MKLYDSEFIHKLYNSSFDYIYDALIINSKYSADSIIEKYSLLEFATQKCTFKVWHMIFYYSGNNINNTPKGKYDDSYNTNLLLLSIYNPDLLVLNFILESNMNNKQKYCNMAINLARSLDKKEHYRKLINSGHANKTLYNDSNNEEDLIDLEKLDKDLISLTLT